MQHIVNTNILSKFASYALASVMLFIGFGCANPLPPSGGPDDATPPEIIEFIPADAALNYRDKDIVLRFSEYVDKNSVIENVRINPELPLEFSWSGKRLTILPNSAMLDNTTYCLSIEPNYKDLSGNKPRTAFSLIFSTGNTIDSGKVIGKVHSKALGFSVFAYRIDNINPDTLNIANCKPDYKINIGSAGEFAIQALKDGTYRLFLINDRNDDGLYSHGYEEFAAAAKDLKVSAADASASDNYCNFYLSKIIDYMPPELNSASAIAARILNLQFSEPIDANYINLNSFSIIDTASKNKVSAISSYLLPNKKSSLNLILSHALDTAAVYYCEINNAISPIRDSAANAMNGLIRSEVFAGSASQAIDSLQFKSFPADSAKLVKLNSPISIQFNQAIAAGGLDSFSLINMSNRKKLPFAYRLLNNSTIEFAPKFALQSNTWYRAAFDLDSIYSALGVKLPDSALSINFLTEDVRLSGSLSGAIKLPNSADHNAKYIILLQANSGSNLYSAVCDSAFNWTFPSLPEGEYTLNAFRDTNANGVYDVGEHYPYIAAELYYSINRKIKVIQRWNVQDLILELSE